MDMDWVLGVDVGGTKILIGRVARDGTIEGERRYPSRRGTQQSATGAVMDAVRGYCTVLSDVPRAVGLGLVGQVDPRAGIWVHSMGTPIREPFPICDLLCAELGLPCYADNDVHCATLAEMQFGIGQTERDFVYLNLGTGTAAGLVSDGRLIRGARNRAGELGHVSSALHPPIRCGCGRDNCVEWIASGGGMIRLAHSLMDQYPDSVLAALDRRGELYSQTIFASAEAGDPLACRVAGIVLDTTVSLMQDIINVMDPAAIAVGGGVLNGGWLLPRAVEQVSAWLAPTCRDLAEKIAISSLDPQRVGLLGAAAHAFARIDER